MGHFITCKSPAADLLFKACILLMRNWEKALGFVMIFGKMDESASLTVIFPSVVSIANEWFVQITNYIRLCNKKLRSNKERQDLLQNHTDVNDVTSLVRKPKLANAKNVTQCKYDSSINCNQNRWSLKSQTFFFSFDQSIYFPLKLMTLKVDNCNVMLRFLLHSQNK